VSNSRLFKAAVDFGLDRYIIHKAFTMQKWRPTYVEDLLDNPPSATETRKLSTKILADVVEALIGTSYISGGLPKALACISLFLPDFDWQSIEHGREVLNNEAPSDEVLPVTMQPLEQLIGYTFTKKALLIEAMTHPSCNGPSIRASLDRLEFLGDAILDYVVVKALFAIDSPTPLENSTLHLLRTALVNADILAFLVMECATTEDRIDVDTIPTPTTTNDPKSSREERNQIILTKTDHPRRLYTFLRHASQDLASAQRATALRHAALRARIWHALNYGSHYPWALLCRLQAQKVYSDVFESLLGAVWVDSGSMEACEGVLERVGIFGVMRRLLADGVWLLHPKEELGRLAGGSKVEYVVVGSEGGVGGEGAEGAEGERVFACQVLVGGVEVGRSEGALSREEARTRAAEVGVRDLKGEGGLNVSVDEVRGGKTHEMEVDEGAVGVAVGGGA
jgi:dsRNA-specific ribonuclease